MARDGFTIDNPYHWPIKIPLATVNDAGLVSPEDQEKINSIPDVPVTGNCLYDFCVLGSATIHGAGFHPIVTFTPPELVFDLEQVQIEYLVQSNNGGVQAQKVAAIFQSLGGVLTFVQQTEIYNQGNSAAIVSQASTDGTQITISVQDIDETPFHVRVRVQGNGWEVT